MRYCGKVGYAIQEEDPERPGIIVPRIVERTYYGDVLRDGKRNENTENFNDNIALSNEFSVVADKFMIEHFLNIAYITHYGTKWRVSSVDTSYPPRIKININGVYNGPKEGGYGPQS